MPLPLGFHHSAATKRKIGLAQKGNKHCLGLYHTTATKRKMSKAHKGHLVSSETKQKISQAHKGKIFSASHKRRISEAHKGHSVSAATRRKLSKAHKGKTVSAEHRRKNLELALPASAKVRAAKARQNIGSLELEVAQCLNKLCIRYQHQKVFGYRIADFYLPDFKLDLECDSEYWHSRSGYQAVDKRHDKYMRSIGVRVIRIKGKDIWKDAMQIVKKALC